MNRLINSVTTHLLKLYEKPRLISRVFLILLVPALFIQCAKDEALVIDKSQKINTRTCSPGSLTESNGRIVFDDLDAFQETIDYLNCASSSDVINWSDNLTTVTAGKALRDFEDLTVGSTVTDGQYSDALDSYSGKIKISTNSDGDYETDELFPIFNEFANLDGEFQIDTAIYKISGNILISVLRPSLVNISELDSETESDTSKGIYVQEIVVLAAGGCCDAFDKDINVYQTNNPRRRVWVDYLVYAINISAPNPLDDFGRLLFPTIGIESRGKSQVRRGFIIHWWVCSERDLQYDIDVEVTHNLPSQWNMPNPVIFSHSASPQDECRVTHFDQEAGGLAQIRPLGEPVWEACVTEVDVVELVITDLLNPPAATLLCL